MFAPLDVSDLSTLWGTTFAAVAVKAFVLLGLALAGSFLLRRAAASTRHFLWTAAIVGLLALPWLGSAVPGWSIDGLALPAIEVTEEPARGSAATWYFTLDQAPDLRPSTTIFESGHETADVSPREIVRPIRFEIGDTGVATPSSALLKNTLDAMRGWSAWTWALLAWELGVLVVLGWLALGWIGLRRLESRSQVVTDEAWIAAAEVAADEMGLKRAPTLLRTDDTMTPLTWGMLRAKVLVPANADDWTEERRIDVLRHEFAHVARRDVLTQFLAQIACAVFWFHPLPWMAATRMRLERERAADDRVLLAGSRASAYAGHLLDMARTLRSEHGLAAASIGMARRSQLGERMDSLLDERGRPRATSKTTRLILGLLVAALVLPLAALRPADLEAAPPERDDRSVDAPAPPLRWPARTVASPPAPPALPGVNGAYVLESARRAPAAPRAYSVSSDFHPIAVAENGGPAFVIRADRLGLGNSTAGPLLADGNEITTKHTTWRSQSDDRTFEIEMSGHIRFTDDESDVELLDDDSYFDLYVDEGRDRRRMEIETDRDGTEERRYFVRGRTTEIDDEAREWFAARVAEFMMMAGVGTRERVDRWIEDDGLDATIDRIERMDGDMAIAAHCRALLERDDLEDDDLRRVLETAGRTIDSDFHKGQLLNDRLRLFIDGEGSVDGLIDLIDSVDSDFVRANVIGDALQIEGIDEDLRAQILVLAEGLDSDFEKARVLSTFPRARFEGDSANAFFGVLRGVDSDFEKTRVLIEALPLALDDPQARADMWRAVEDIDSDLERANFVAALAPKLTDDEMVAEALEVVEGIDSDFERARALREFIPLVADGSDAIQDAFVRTAESIESDHEYGRLMREFRAASR